jgi:mannose-6-phosphate isomerase-like protein (cupin superfamily)
MTEIPRQRRVKTTGRPRDADGTAINGPALAFDPDSPAGTLFQDSPHPLVSDPDAGLWAALLEHPEDGDTDRPVLLQWLTPNAPEPPAHVHPATETFEAVEGELTVLVEGDPIRLAPGETLTVDPGQEHTFRNPTDDTVAFRAALPSMLTVRGLYTTWGLSHDGRLDTGDPAGLGPLRGLLLAEDLHPETTMTMAPAPVQRLLWATIGRLARALGHSGVEEHYLDDAFWERHVEQPAASAKDS